LHQLDILLHIMQTKNKKIRRFNWQLKNMRKLNIEKKLN